MGSPRTCGQPVSPQARGDHDQAALAATVANVSGQATGALLGDVLGQWAPMPLRLVLLVHVGLLVLALTLLLHVLSDARPRETHRIRPQRLGVPAPMRHLFIVNALGAFAMSAVLGLYSSLTLSCRHCSSSPASRSPEPCRSC
jgi:hypothetical protein